MQSASKLAFGGIIIGQGLLSLLLYFYPHYYDVFSQEDGLAENTSAILLFLSGCLLIYKPFRSEGFAMKWHKYLFILAGLSLILAAGEEISWGQRLFNFETPVALEEINDQNEFNFHNINKKFFDRLLDRTSILLVLLSAIFHWRGKKHFLHFSLPDVWLTMTFIAMLFYRQFVNQDLDFYNGLGYLAMVILLTFALKSKFKALLIASIGLIAWTIFLTFYHDIQSSLFIDHNNSANEYRELMFTFCVWMYAHQIKLKK
jgi:hypothetical protein